MPSTDWKENVLPDEDARFEGYAERLRALQDRAPAGAPRLRALHAKGHLGLTAKLEILPDLPEHARQGLFAAPGNYEALVRFSNGSGKRRGDKAGDVRGIAIKVLGVTGKKVLGDAATQDLLLIQSSATPFHTPDEFVAFVFAAQSPALLLFRLLGALGLGRGLQVLKRLAASATTVGSLADLHFYSALPIRVGPYAARYALAPKHPASSSAAGRGPDYLGEELASRVARSDLSYDLMLQFFEDEARTPIEDAAVDWDTPYVTVGRFTIPKQDANTREGRELAARIETLSFDPWHALEEHRPLGAMMRARKHAYFASTKARNAIPD
jgi:hypothetical protein